MAHVSVTGCTLLNSQQRTLFCVTFTAKQYVCQNAHLRKQTCVIYTNNHMYVIVYDRASVCNYVVRAVFASQQLRLLKHAVIHNGSRDSDQSEAIAHECSSQVLRYSLFVPRRDIHTTEYPTCDTRTSTTVSNTQHRRLIRTQHRLYVETSYCNSWSRLSFFLFWRNLVRRCFSIKKESTQ